MAQQSSSSSQSKGTGQEAAEAARKEVSVRGSQLVDRFKEIVEEGNARRVIIKHEGRSVMEIPLTAAAGGAAAAVALSPTLAALGAFASLATDVKIVIEKRPEKAGAGGSPEGAASSPPAPPKPNA